VRIVYVEYAPAESEDWEFVLIENRGPGDQDMSNWTLSNERGDAYTFPKGFILPVDGSVRVWTKMDRIARSNCTGGVRRRPGITPATPLRSGMAMARQWTGGVGRRHDRRCGPCHTM